MLSTRFTPSTGNGMHRVTTPPDARKPSVYRSSSAGLSGSSAIAGVPKEALAAPNLNPLQTPQGRVHVNAGGQAQRGSATRETADFGVTQAGVVSLMPSSGIQYSRMMTGLVPESDQANIVFYRDMYDFDAVCGAVIDMHSTFPWSEYSLVGLDSHELQPYQAAAERMNLRTLMADVTRLYLTDGAFIGTPVHDPNANIFRDIMIHDWAACQAVPSPFYSSAPHITLQVSPAFQQFLSLNSPYVRSLKEDYPAAFLNAFRHGTVQLDPLLTIFIPRRGTVDKISQSFLRRVLPAYMIEKSLYRGTLIEAHRRMRPVTHVQLGTDKWEPNPGEILGTLQDFQMAESDPLGGFIVTRQGVQVQDIRQPGDLWRWPDLMEQLTPYKLRALSTSEAYLSAEAQFANAEVAMSVFMESQAALRDYLTYKMLTESLFPLIAVTNRMYHDINKAKTGSDIVAFMENLRHRQNLRIPEVRWHKALDNVNPQMMDVLNTLAEKGIPVPIRMWCAAANVTMDMLLGQLRDDEKLKAAIATITGKPVDTAAGASGDGMDDGGSEFATARELAVLRAMRGEGGSTPAYGSDSTRSMRIASRTKPVLQRQMLYPEGTPQSEVVNISKGKAHAIPAHRQRSHVHDINQKIMAAAAAIRDPNRAAQVKRNLIAKHGTFPFLPLT